MYIKINEKKFHFNDVNGNWLNYLLEESVKSNKYIVEHFNEDDISLLYFKHHDNIKLKKNEWDVKYTVDLNQIRDGLNCIVRIIAEDCGVFIPVWQYDECIKKGKMTLEEYNKREEEREYMYNQCK